MEKNWTQTKKVSFDRNNVSEMNNIAKTIFAPIYPVVARNAVAVTGISRGLCIDLGSGPAMLSIAVAREAPGMEVVAFDFSDDSMGFARENILEAGLTDRIRTMTGDVHAMPLEDNSADLIISRGSMFFWDDLQGAFREIYRVLSPGGATYLGGGFGNHEIREQVVSEMLKRNPDWSCYAKKKAGDGDIARFETMFREIGCDSHRIINDETGFWVVISKAA